jgi:hypothetical protein
MLRIAPRRKKRRYSHPFHPNISATASAVEARANIAIPAA